MLRGLVGLNGLAVNPAIGPSELAMVALGAFIAFLMPNTNQIVLYVGNRFPDAQAAFSLIRVQWRPTLGWALAMGTLLVIGLLNLDKTAEFIYAQF